MSEQPVALLPDDTLYPALAALRATHSKLLEAHRTQATSDAFWQEVETFLRRGSRSGALLDRDEERWAAQGLLDYWIATAYSTGHTMPDAALVDFDPTLAPALPDEQCPYVGLAAFHEGREKYFFGRERLLSTLVAQVAASRLVAVVGPSGSGKSSLVLAGLIPLLKQGAIAGEAGVAGSASWRYLPRLVPGSEPLVNLGAVLQPAADSPPLDLTLAAQVVFAPDGLRRTADYLVTLLNATSQQPAVLLVDQFEELFTLCTDEESRTAFINNLLTLVETPGLRHTVILTMRTDFESFVARVPALLPLFEAATVRVTPLNAAELRAVIEKPAELVGLKFEAGIIDALVQDLLGEPAALPLLQFTLLKLWEQRDRNRITWETYKRLGGGRLALARSADQLYENLIPEDQVTARRILLRLVRPGEGLEVTSNRVRLRTLYQTGEARDRVERVLQKLVNADLVRLTTGERPEDSQVEVAHEALVRNWPRLVGWLEDERTRIRERLRVTDAAEQWFKLNRDPGALLRGTLLEDALHYADLNEREQAFIQASQAALAASVREKEAMRQRELEQARALAKEQERLAKSERQWAEFQAQTAAKLRQRAWLLTGIVVIALLCAAAAAWFALRTNWESTRAEEASKSALAQATVAEYARSEAIIQASLANESRRAAEQQVYIVQTAEAVARSEAAAARTAEAELQEKQERLRHLAAALSYTGEQIDQLEQLLSNLSATVDHTNQLPDSNNGVPHVTPIAPVLTPTATMTAPLGQETPVAAMRPELIARLPLTTMQNLTDTAALTATVTRDQARLDITVPDTVIASGTLSTPLRIQNVIAVVPDVDINLYSEASEKSPVLRILRAPDQLTVLQADAYWIQAATSDGVIGWVEAYWLTYTGDTAQLPRALQYRVEATPVAIAQNGNKIPFTYGRVSSVDGATAYPLLDDPYNAASQLTTAPVDAAVTLLFAANGPVFSGSKLWYYVQMADPEGQNMLWQGYLPAAVIEPR